MITHRQYEAACVGRFVYTLPLFFFLFLQIAFLEGILSTAGHFDPYSTCMFILLYIVTYELIVWTPLFRRWTEGQMTEFRWWACIFLATMIQILVITVAFQVIHCHRRDVEKEETRVTTNSTSTDSSNSTVQAQKNFSSTVQTYSATQCYAPGFYLLMYLYHGLHIGAWLELARVTFKPGTNFMTLVLWSQGVNGFHYFFPTDYPVGFMPTCWMTYLASALMWRVLKNIPPPPPPDIAIVPAEENVRGTITV